MLNSSSSSLLFFLPWRKGSTTQSECGGDDRDAPSRQRRDGNHHRTSSWSTKARQDMLETNNRSSPLHFPPSVSTLNYLPQTGRLPRSHQKAYSTVGTVSPLNSPRSPRPKKSVELPNTQLCQTDISKMEPSVPYVSVQEKLLASLFQRQHRTSKRKTKELQYKYGSRAATQCDMADLQDRDPFIDSWGDPFSPAKPTLRQIPTKRSHIYAQSEYHNDGAYKARQLKRASKYSTIAEEVDDGLNEWGLPKLLVATRYEDEPEEEDGNNFGSDFSDEEGSLLEQAESVTFQQIVKEHVRPQNYSTNSTMVGTSTLEFPARTHSKIPSISPKIVVTLRTLEKFLTLAYVLCIVCPTARLKSKSLLNAFQISRLDQSRILAYVIALSHSLATPSRKSFSRRISQASAIEASPISSASTLVTKRIKKNKSKSKSSNRNSRISSTTRSSKGYPSRHHVMPASVDERYSSWGF